MVLVDLIRGLQHHTATTDLQKGGVAHETVNIGRAAATTGTGQGSIGRYVALLLLAVVVLT